MTTEEKEAWNNVAASWPLLNKFGDQYYPSGYQLFMQLNGNLVSKGFPYLTTPGVKRTIPNPDDSVVVQTDLFAFTPRSAASFVFPPSLSASGNSPFCPQCYDNINGTCVPTTTGPTWDNCVIGTEDTFSVVLQGECSVDQDCVDAGLGTATDVECQDGVCVYVGDGITNVYNSGYVFNMSSMLRNNGVWAYDDEAVNDVFTLSFQLTSFDEITKMLLTGSDPIIIVSNYRGDNSGFHIRIRPQDTTYCLFEIGFAFNKQGTALNKGTSINQVRVPIAYLKNSPTIVINMDFLSPLRFRFNIGDSGWLNYETYGWDGWQDWKVADWGAPDFTGNYADNNWNVEEDMWGLIFGAGVEGTQYNYAIADIRGWDFLLDINEVEQVSRNLVLTTERALFPLNGKPRPKCSFDICDGTSPCQGTKECVCKHSICGYWDNPTLGNYAANDPIDVQIQFASPVFLFTDPGAGDYSLTFSGFWINKTTGVFSDNQAIYAPSLTVTVPEPTESGFVAVFSASYPGSKSTGSSQGVYIGNRSMNQILTTELQPLLKSAISNFPDSSYFSVFIDILDITTGELAGPPRRKRRVIRFKAGSELSSSVN